MPDDHSHSYDRPDTCCSLPARRESGNSTVRSLAKCSLLDLEDQECGADKKQDNNNGPAIRKGSDSDLVSIVRVGGDTAAAAGQEEEEKQCEKGGGENGFDGDTEDDKENDGKCEEEEDEFQASSDDYHKHSETAEDDIDDSYSVGSDEAASDTTLSDVYGDTTGDERQKTGKSNPRRDAATSDDSSLWAELIEKEEKEEEKLKKKEEENEKDATPKEDAPAIVKVIFWAKSVNQTVLFNNKTLKYCLQATDAQGQKTFPTSSSSDGVLMENVGFGPPPKSLQAFMVELRVGNYMFPGWGWTREDAQNQAAALALKMIEKNEKTAVAARDKEANRSDGKGGERGGKTSKAKDLVQRETNVWNMRRLAELPSPSSKERDEEGDDYSTTSSLSLSLPPHDREVYNKDYPPLDSAAHPAAAGGAASAATSAAVSRCGSAAKSRSASRNEGHALNMHPVARVHRVGVNLGVKTTCEVQTSWHIYICLYTIPCIKKALMRVFLEAHSSEIFKVLYEYCTVRSR